MPSSNQNQPSPAVTRLKALLDRARVNLFAIDLCVIGFLGLLIAWTLLSMVAPDARLYAWDARYTWAEMPKAGLVAQMAAFLAGYLVVQRIGIAYHRRHVLTGRPGGRWFAAGHLLHVLAPMMLLPLVFNMLGGFIASVSGAPAPDVHPDFDAAAHYDRAVTWWDLELKRIDIALFGVYLPEWFRDWHRPWLTGVLMLCYLSYYLSPFVTAGKQIALRQWPLVRRLGAVFVGTLLLTYLGYLAVPATGPRFEGTFEAWLIEEPGWFAARWWQLVLDEAEIIRWDAFPSGHVAVALVALLLAWRHSRRLSIAYAPLFIGLVWATVFFGYHYATDVIAGVVFAAAGVLVILPLVKWWDKPNTP
jgi:membrane-associated phospholipid phosphatase